MSGQDTSIVVLQLWKTLLLQRTGLALIPEVGTILFTTSTDSKFTGQIEPSIERERLISVPFFPVESLKKVINVNTADIIVEAV